MSLYIKRLIQQGEHQQLDFKFEISDSRKIARTFSAFANTHGGTLLIGVKDNGNIAGIRTDEEYYMAEAAAQMYCRPSVPFTFEKWVIDGKTILEIKIPKSDNIPHLSKDKNDRWMAYIRVDDRIMLANSVLLKVWKRRKLKSGILLKYTKTENIILNYLIENKTITLSKFTKIATISRYNAENILANLIAFNILEMIITENGIYYKLSQEAGNPEMGKIKSRALPGRNTN